MQKVIRLACVALASGAALALAGPAAAAYTPRLVVTGTAQGLGATGALTFALTTLPADDGTAKLVLYAPPGYGLTLGQVTGTPLGKAQAQAISRTLGGSVLPLAGNVVADDPAKHTGNACAPGAHQAVWLLRLNGVGQTIQVPLYVDRVTTGAEAAFASWRVQACLPSPDVPESQGGAKLGAKLTSIRFSIGAMFTNPEAAGSHVWRSTLTPYAPSSATIDAARAVEARSTVSLPGLLSLTAVLNQRTGIVTLRGTLTEGGAPVARQTVRLLMGTTAKNPKVFRIVETSVRGTLVSTIRLAEKRTRYLSAYVNVATRDDGVSGCSGASIAPAGCVSATRGTFRASSAGTITIRRR